MERLKPIGRYFVLATWPFLLQSFAPFSAAAAEPAVTGLVLVDVATNKDIRSLEDGDQINLAKIGTRRLNVRAIVSGEPVKEVVFSLDRDKRFRVESSAPYSLAGDVAGKYRAWTPRVGTHSIVVRVNPSKGNESDDSYSVTFKVIDDPKSAGDSVSPRTAEQKEVPQVVSESTPREPVERASIRNDAIQAQPVSPTPTISFHPDKPFHLRINCGGAALVDQNGNEWVSDETFGSGGMFGNTTTTSDPLGIAVFQSGRDSASKPLEYHIPVPNGVYAVTFHFMELYVATPGKSVFDVFAEQLPILTDIDIVNLAGPYRLYSATRTAIVTDGVLDLSFVAKVGFASVNGLEVKRVAS